MLRSVLHYAGVDQLGIAGEGDGFVGVMHHQVAARDNNFAKQDCSAANENMALAAKSLGLASRYLDVPNLYTNTPEGAGCKEMCGIPKDYDTVCFLCLGYSDDISEQPTPKRGDVVNYVD